MRDGRGGRGIGTPPSPTSMRIDVATMAPGGPGGSPTPPGGVRTPPDPPWGGSRTPPGGVPRGGQKWPKMAKKWPKMAPKGAF